MSQNKQAELDHARKILHNPEFYWNSATKAGLKGSIRRAQWVIRQSAMGQGSRVLEIGCGTGFFSDFFIKAGAQLTAIDLSEALVEKARQRCPALATFQVCDVESMPFADQSFDIAVGIRVLHHLDLKAAFKEIRRVLKPSGKIAFCEPNMLNPQIMIQKNVPIIKKWMGDTPDETAFFKWRLRKFLEEQGFTQIFIEPYDFLHPWIPSFMADTVEKVGYVLEKTPVLRQIAGSLFISACKA